MKTFLHAILVISASLLVPAASRSQGVPANGTLYFTTFSGGVDVHSVSYNFTGSSFTLGSVSGIASTPGADGIVFTSDGFLAVGGQGNAVYRVNPTMGTFTSQNAGGTSAYHMMAAPDGTIYSSGISGTPASYNGTLTVNGTAHPLNGDDTSLDTIIWDTKNGKVYYTSSGSGGVGNFGLLNTTTWTTTRLDTGLAAAHGGYYDAFSDTIILQGDSHITQLDPNTPGVPVIGDVSGVGTFDQGTVDGLGHIFAANNDGNLTFIDYSTTKNISTADYTTTTFLAGSLDDVAPLSGAGSQPVPESLGFSTVVIWFTLFLGICTWQRRRLFATA
jgi:hypothetical protein